MTSCITLADTDDIDCVVVCEVIVTAAVVRIKDGTPVVIKEYRTKSEALDNLLDWKRQYPGEKLGVSQIVQTMP